MSPPANLDPALSEEIMDLFKDFARVGVAVLIATHDLSLIARYNPPPAGPCAKAA